MDQSGLIKGAWSKEEDNLLRQCIAKIGEGKWYQVPSSAGLNRCRRSCRLRWVNYLKPDIKRGDFGDDEVDLILRLHKLLGNRWSLIAGRLTGRTANDVKNFWNTKRRQETRSRRLSNTKDKLQDTVKHIILRPKPRRFLSSHRVTGGEGLIGDQIQLKKNLSMALSTSSASPTPASSLIQQEVDLLKSLFRGRGGEYPNDNLFWFDLSRIIY